MVEPSEPRGRPAERAGTASGGVLTTPSVSLERTYATAPDVLTDVLDQFARNFLLNDLSEQESEKLIGRTGAVRFALPRREARRRNSTLEQVHQARVSVRRLRSTLRTFHALFAPHWLMPLDTELSWFAAALGEVRDLDVLGDSIAKTLWLIEDDRVRTLVSSRLERQGEGARDRLSLERSTKRYACLVDDIASIGASAQFIVTPADHAAEALRPSVEGTWDEVKRLRRKAKRDPSTDRLHRVRIELKRLQCACEVVGLVDSKEVLNVARAASSAQSRLGVVHDAAVASAWLGSLVVAEPRLKGPLGAIIRAHDDQRKDARRGWLDALAKVERRWDRWAI